MKKVYQKIINPQNGDCMRAAIASLLDEEYENVPHFLEFGESWFEEFRKYMLGKGYKFSGILYNKIWAKLENPTCNCFERSEFSKPHILSKANLKKERGIYGFYYSSVLSPKFYTWENPVTHAVICDKDFKIIHDPNDGNSNILQYPLADVIGCNGIINVYKFKKIV